MSKTKFSYTELYKAITEKRKRRSAVFIDKMADTTCDSEFCLRTGRPWALRTENRSPGFTVQAAEYFSYVEALLAVYS